MSKKTNPPSHRVHAVTKEGKETYWRAFGAVWPHSDRQGFHMKLDYLPLNGKQRRALGILAGAQRGATHALLLANGFKPKLLAGLVLAELAVVEAETVRVGGPTVMVKRYCITDAGRQALLEE